MHTSNGQQIVQKNIIVPAKIEPSDVLSDSFYKYLCIVEVEERIHNKLGTFNSSSINPLEELTLTISAHCFVIDRGKDKLVPF